MAKERAHIKAIFNGTCIGYVKSVYYTKGNFKLTTNIQEAKGYATADRCHADIDFLTSIAYDKGYVFIYD